MAGRVTYQFLPWARSGLAAQLPDADTLGSGLPLRARLGVEVVVGRTAGAPIEISRPIEVSGPGDVSGIDQRQVIRMEPRPNASDFEPNFLPFVEFDRPDFPWLLTPAAPTADGRLRPWLALVVVERGEGSPLSSGGGDPLPVLTTRSDELPDLDDSWAWAHAQVVVGEGEQPADVLAQRPERTGSRLVCPRRLAPLTAYVACVVPAFDAGRLAGMGLPPDPNATSLAPAWDASAGVATKLPVYFSWEFRTGEGGDFESLARALRPRPVPQEVGRRRMFVGGAGPPLPALAPDDEGAVVDLRGALVPPKQDAAPWPAATRSQVEAGLTRLLDLPAQRLGSAGADDGPAVATPLYGRWLAGHSTVPAATAAPRWLRTLNLDPRHRAVAGLATNVVQQEQERLMEEAWAQVGQIERANRELRWAQLATQVRDSMLRRHVAPQPPGRVLQLAATARHRLLLGEATLAATTTVSALPDEVLSASFRRAVRPRGPLARRAYAPDDRTVRPFVEALDVGTLRVDPPDRPPDGLFGFSVPAPARREVSADVLAGIASAAATSAAVRPKAPSATGVRAAVVSDAVAERIGGRLFSRRGGGGVLTEALRQRMRLAAVKFRDMTAATVDRIDDLAVPELDPAPPLGAAGLSPQVLARLDPFQTVRARVEQRIAVPPHLRPQAIRDPLDSVLATPRFPQPAWQLLRDRYPDHLLAGLEHLTANSVSLMQTNQAFVEAFMVGLNHELARELLWREFPTDLRGTAFRRFWAPGGVDDIDAIHGWDGDAVLGGNVRGGPDGHLVVVVRGDLLRRYPSTVIYAAPDAGGRPDVTEASVEVPLFRGRIGPDVAFAGFALSADDARSRWWFVFEEQPTEPRFGLDAAPGAGPSAPALNEWNDLAWGHLASTEEELAALRHIALDSFAPMGPPPDGPRWGATAADMAAILVQQPVRVTMRGSDLLPPPTT